MEKKKRLRMLFTSFIVSWWEKNDYIHVLKCSRSQMCWTSVLIIFHYRKKNIYFTNFWVLVVGSSFCHNNLYRKKNKKSWRNLLQVSHTFYFKYQLKMLAVSRMGFNTFLLSLIKFSVKICWAGFESRWVKMNIDNSILVSFPWYYWYTIHL